MPQSGHYATKSLNRSGERQGVAGFIGISGRFQRITHYYRKMLAVVGWKGGESKVGKALAGGRQKTKDLFDVHYLSAHVELLSQWFPSHFDQNAYERLTAWYLSIPKQKMIMELLDLVHDCNTKLVFKHLDDEIIHKLNREYAGI